MRINVILLALGLTTIIGCGRDNDKKKPTDIETINTLKSIDKGLPSQIVSRVPVINGTPNFAKVEAIKVTKSIDLNSPEALNAAFANATADERLTDIALIGDSLDSESSSDQYCCRRGGAWPRPRPYILPWRRRTANALYELGYGYNNFYRPYTPVATGCCMTYQAGCGASANNYYSYQSYQSYQSSTFSSGGYNGWINGNVQPYGQYNDGYMGNGFYN